MPSNSREMCPSRKCLPSSISLSSKNSVDAIYSFPIGAEKPTIQKQKSRGMGGMGNTVGFYALNGPDDLWQLKEKSDQIEKDLLTDKIICYPTKEAVFATRIRRFFPNYWWKLVAKNS